MNDTRPMEEYVSELGPRFYQQLVTIREFEQRVAELYMQALIPGIAHVSIGQEAVAVGVCGALRRDDYITSTHRGHGHSLAKGASPDRMFAELLGKEEGFCHGKGGSMHIADPRRAIWAPTPSSAAAWRSRRARRWAPNGPARGRWRYASSAMAR